MDAITSEVDSRINAELYKALSKGEDAKVVQQCGLLPNGPFHRVTIHKDTVLHMACYNKRNKLVVELVRRVPESDFEKLTWKNSSGNTILHETATNNGMVEAARELLRRAPSLLSMTNGIGETPLFRAARYGRSQAFKFFNVEVNKAILKEAVYLRTFLLRYDHSTILHTAILSGNFELATFIAKAYPSLAGEKDGAGMTSLQLLACNPSAFDRGLRGGFIMGLIYKYINASPDRTSRVPMLEEIRKKKRSCESAKELAKLLIESDNSWKETQSRADQYRTKFHKYKGKAGEGGPDAALEPHILDTPLLLATKSGCTEIVKGILEVYPQAVEHIDEDGRNIFHVAIKYRRKEIIDTVMNMSYPVRRLRAKIDKAGNTILHMVGIKVQDRKAEEDIRSPAIVLRDDLILFEHVKQACTTLATLQLSSNGETAEQLLIANNTQLRIDAKEWMMSTAKNCSIVAVLIATVAFAAAYTVPGGPNENTGYPILKNKPLFIVFALADALSLTFSLTSVMIFLSILTSTFKLKEFRSSLHSKLLLGLTVLILSVSMMMIAFAATLVLTISSGKNWTNIILYVISLFPVSVFVVSYASLYELLIKAFDQTLRKILAALQPTRDVKPPPVTLHSEPPPQAPTTSFHTSTMSSLV